MFIIKCDLCKKEIKNKPVMAGFGYLEKVELCEKCGLPVLKFLKKYKLVEDKKKKLRK